MSDLHAGSAAAVAAPTDSGLAAPTGQASSTPPDANNQPAPVATPSAQAPESPRTPKYRFKDQSEAEKAHSELQSRYSRVGDPEQAAQRLALLTSLQGDPDFVEWAKARLAKQEAGSGDPETAKAVEIVNNISRARVQEAMAPVLQHMARGQIAAVVTAMEKAHGKDWMEARPEMELLFTRWTQAGLVAPNVNPYLNYDLTDALYKAVRGEDREAAAYRKRLETKQAASTQASAGTAPVAVATPQPRGFDAAFAAAKRAHGIV